MKEEHLRFEKCLSLLDHSFIKTDSELIDFQHPTIRDLLMEILRNDTSVRRRYIATLAPNGLASVIEGVRYFRKTSLAEPVIHVLVLENADELQLLKKRITDVLTEPIPFYQMERVLDSCATLARDNEVVIASDKKVKLSSDSERWANTYECSGCGDVTAHIYMQYHLLLVGMDIRPQESVYPFILP